MIYVGIDVAKNSGVCALRPVGRPFRFEFDDAGFDLLRSRLRVLQESQADNPICVVLEGTGDYERPLLKVLREDQIACVVANPLRVRRFWQAMGRDEKNDPLDARGLIAFAEATQPLPQELPDDRAEKRRDLSARREQIVEQLNREKNRLQQVWDLDVRRLLEQAIDVYEQQLKEIDCLLQKAIMDDEQARQKSVLLQSIPGIAQVTAAKLISAGPELGRLTRKQVARLAGLAPLCRESGQWRGKRTIGGGRKSLRTALYMSALTAIRGKNRLRDHYLHLLAQGKAKMTAVVAIMRKLIVIANAVLKTGQPWQGMI